MGAVYEAVHETIERRVAIKVLNIFRTLVHAPKALKAFLAWGNYILSKRNALHERDRELVILRTGYNCRSGYEFTQHHRIGLDGGLREAEIEAIKEMLEAEEQELRWTCAPGCIIAASSLSL